MDLAIQAYDSPHTKAFLLLQVGPFGNHRWVMSMFQGLASKELVQAHMWSIALPINDYKTDLKWLAKAARAPLNQGRSWIDPSL